MQIRIEGNVRRGPGSPGTPVVGVTVVAYDLASGHVVGTAVTSSPIGDFLIIGAVVIAATVAVNARIAFRVVDCDEVLLDTEDEQTWDGDIVALVLDQTTAEARVHGFVRSISGEPVACDVELLRKTLAGSDSLWTVPTSPEDGSYEFVDSGTPIWVDANDLIEVIAREGTTEVARAERVGPGQIDLVASATANVPQGPTEYDHLEATLLDILPSGDFATEVSVLTQEQVVYISARTNLEPTLLVTLIRASAIVTRPGLDDVELDFVYALARMGVPMSWYEFLAAFETFPPLIGRAIEQRIVTEDRVVVGQPFHPDLEVVRTKLVERVVNAPALAAAETSGDIDSTQRGNIAAAAATHDGTPGALWAGLRSSIGDEPIDAVQDALRLEMVTGGATTLMDDLLAARGTWNNARNLAALSVEEWDGDYGVSEEDAKELRERLAEAYPTRQVTADLATDDPALEPLREFAAWAVEENDANTDGVTYEMGVTPLVHWLNEHENGSGESTEELLELAGPVERLFRIAGDKNKSRNVAALRAAGYESALEVVRKGRTAFVAHVESSLGGNLTEARAEANAIFDRAAHVHSMTVAIASRYGAAFNVGATEILGAAAPSGPPDWATLFGSLDYCACEHCQSVLSPAAYLVDVLQFLRERPKGAATSALTVLDARRPDLLDLPLTCENTNATLPYIDLANELLERRVATGTGVLTTTWVADDLAVHPEHVLDGAYSTLTTATFPFGLPYDLAVDESRAYLARLGVARERLLESEDWPPSDDLLSEQLGLFPGDLALLRNTPSKEAPELWGVSAFSALENVLTVMSRAQVSYEQLTELLSAHFVRGGAPAVGIEFPEGGCDLTTATFTTSWTTAVAARLARFIRLWRRVGGTISTVDRVVAAWTSTSGEVPNDGLYRLGVAASLSRRLGLTLAETAAWEVGLSTRLERDGTSEYERIFVDPARAATHPFRLNSTRDQLAASQVIFDPASSAPASNEAIREVARALRIRVEDAVTLARFLLGTGPELNSSLSTLGQLHTLASVARAFRLSIPALVTYFEVHQQGSIWVGAMPHIADALAADRGLGMTPSDVAYVTRPHANPHDPSLEKIFTLFEAIRAELEKINATAGLEVTVDDSATSLDEMLHELFETTVVDSLVEMIDDDPTTWTTTEQDEARALIDARFPEFATVAELAVAKNKLVNAGSALLLTSPERRAYVESVLRPGLLLRQRARALLEVLFPEATSGDVAEEIFTAAIRWTGWTTELRAQANALIDAEFGLLMLTSETTNAKNKLVNDGGTFLASVHDRLEYLEPFLIDAWRLQARISAVVDAMAPTTSATAPVIEAILTAGLHEAGSTSRYAIETFLGLPANVRDRTMTVVRTALKTYRRVHKLAFAAARAEMPADEIRAVAGFFAWDTLPTPNDGLTATTAPFDQPASGGDEDVTVGSSAWMAVGQTVFVDGGGFYRVSAILGISQVTLVNLGHPANRPATQTVPLGAAVSAMSPTDAVLNYSTWETFRDFKVNRDRTNGRFLEIALAAMGSGATRGDVIVAFADATGIALEDVTFLAGSTALNMAAPTDFFEFIDPALHFMDLIRPFGVSAATAWGWRTLPTDWTLRRAQAEEVKAAAVAKTPPARKVEALRPVRDRLRERQRDALLAHVRAGHDDSEDVALVTADTISEELLIDVSTTAAVATSRIKQALSSVQQFVQRASLNLESAVALTRDDLKPWQWMKNYRVWEANRKVFLWPENWIEPELRDDKTEFFRDLENQLLQDDLNEDNVERAYSDYLQKLLDVAHVEIPAMYHERREDVGEERLHVFGRTFSSPQKYFWRVCRDGAWSGWEKLDVGIEGEHLLPLMIGRRLHIFWPLIQEVDEPKPDEPALQHQTMKSAYRAEDSGGADFNLPDSDSDKPKKRFAIQLAWSSRFAGEWQAKKWIERSVPLSWLQDDSSLVPVGGWHPWQLLSMWARPLEGGDYFISMMKRGESTS